MYHSVPAWIFRHRSATVLFATCIVVTAFGAAAESPAQPETDAPLRPYFVGEVVVTSDTGDPTEAPGNVEVMENEEIRALGVRSVAEALENMVGVSVSTGPRNEQHIWVRGYQQADVLVLVDGIPIADPYSGEVDLGQIPVSDVARITVTRGGASVLYGPNGLGGVINIVTFQAEEGLNAEANLRLADNSTFLAHGAAGGKNGSFDWYLGAGLEQSDGFSLSEDFQTEPYQPQGLRLNSDLERFSIIGRVGMELSEADRFSVTLRWIDSEKGIPFHTTRPSGFVKFSRFPEWRQGTFTLGWQRDLTGEGSIRAQIFSHHFDNTLDVFSGPELEERLLRSTFADRVVGGFIVGDKRFGAHLLSGAIHLREDHHRRFEETEVSSMELVERFTALTGSAGAEGRLTLGKRSVMILGATLDHNAVTESWNSQTGEMNHTSETVFSPQGEVRTLFKGNLTGSLAVYRRTRFPTLRQLFSGNVPSPTLKPETVTGANMSLRWRPNNAISFSGALYFDQVKDLISRVGRAFPYENHDEAEISGLEFSGRGQWNRLDCRVSGTWQSAEFTASSQSMEEIPFVPEATTDVGIALRVGRSTHLRTSWQWVGERIFYEWGDRRELPDYSLVRVAVAHQWKNLELRIDLENALDANIEQEWGYPLSGRRLWVGFAYNFVGH